MEQNKNPKDSKDNQKAGKSDTNHKPKRIREMSQSRSSNRRASLANSWKSANAFINFMQDFRKQNPDVKSPHTFRQAGETWQNMSKEDKQPYVDAANGVKRQKLRDDQSVKKRSVTPASKKNALATKKEEPKSKNHDPNEGSDSAASTEAHTDETLTADESGGDE
ncbi:DNA-binding protein MNB1B-like [Belonocnema kinseyi]|uniref:DNA-binding protein MNB1B-like n=1 Tax=Belonocnema kinseyi TaxID=2817044 RepID=UPI00143DE098|nr:DNA-binding protein MNB1B-like [Belonocnema kinseyi]XP_033226891.1 DNA-binding protein MNB1B-like [Belonocnema kinseyi]XP_033226892.1 DNA-binding protein MNB1B-like [Belonocnema kinseyi]